MPRRESLEAGGRKEPPFTSFSDLGKPGVQDILKRFARKLLKSDDIEDLVQNTNVKALENRESFQEKTNLLSWLYRIMQNSFLDDTRQIGRAHV